MPAKSVVTRSNLSRDFVVNPAKTHGGALELNLDPGDFTRNPTTGRISVTGGGGGGGGEVVISPQPGNIAELLGDGLFVPDTSSVSAVAGNIIQVLPDGIYVGNEAISTRAGNMVSRVAGAGAGLYAGAPAVYTTGANYTIRPQETNMLVLLTNGADTVDVPLGGILAFAEFTLLKTNGPFTVAFPEGVSGNGIDGPCSFTVQALPNGVVLKNLAADSWLLLGDAVLVE